MATPAPEDWILKDAAAEQLGLSPRQVERYAAAGKIRMKLVRIAGDRSDRNVYSMEDIRAILTERESGTLKLVERGNTGLMAPEGPFFATLAAVLKQTAPPPRMDKAWLTLQEAAAYSGLPAPEIARLVRELQVYAMGRGRATWRIQRESLDEWGRMVHLVPKKQR
jgi:excisionase family DNA binding protein